MDEAAIKRIVESAAGSFKKSLKVYWPSEGGNEICERNVTLHLSHVLLKKGFAVFAECHKKGMTSSRFDLVGIDTASSAQIVAEAKRLYSLQMARSIRDDVVRMSTFNLIDGELDRRLNHKYGIVLATTWKAEYQQWWISTDGASPTTRSEREWNKIRNHACLKGAVRGSVLLQQDDAENDPSRRKQYLLYWIFRRR